MEKQVLTTAEAARLLGVSVRTVQLLVESGGLRSWKTPGGHRRVQRADVLAYMTQAHRMPEHASALVILVTSPERKGVIDSRLATVGECLVETFFDTYGAAFAIGARLPATVIVDLDDHREERLAFLHQLTSHPELGTTRFITVAESDIALAPKVQQRVLVTTLNELPGVLRATFTPPAPFTGLPISDAGELPYPVAANESQRLAAVERSGLLTTPPEPVFDRLTWLASHHLRLPVSLMTVLTSTRQHFKSRVGLDLTGTPRRWAICNHTILQRRVFSVPDLSRTPPFSTQPAIAGPPHFRFYAGAPVFDADGFALGALCVMDYEPHELDAEQE